MKTNKTTPSVTKLIAQFDDQLLEILLEDLRNRNLRTQFMSNNKQDAAQQTRTAA